MDATTDHTVFAARFEPVVVDRSLPRSSRVSKAKQKNQTVRKNIETWIDHVGMTDHIKVLPEGESFNTLFLAVDDQGHKMLPEVPELVAYSPCEEIALELL